MTRVHVEPKNIDSLLTRPISVTFFFTAYSFQEYVQSNQSNTLNRIKPSQQEKPLSLQFSYLFLRACVSSLLNEESMLRPCNHGRRKNKLN